MPPKKPLPLDDTYLQIWKIEQEHSRTRWTVTTFFLSISFAILGLSFDARDNPAYLWGFSLPDLQRLIGLFVYWFGYFLFAQFNRYSNFLRSRLREMETKKQVSFTLQSDSRDFMYPRWRSAFSASRLLFYFGILYTISVVLLLRAS
jgi:hypothetical protein